MIGASKRASDFFITGGTLPADSPSYVKRQADEELFNLASASEFCYLLTPRQMGKSSLMVRTARRLREQGVSTATIELPSIGTDVSIEQWYLGLITHLKSQLKLSVDTEDWWAERASFGPVQRFTDFLRDMVLADIEGSVVIFVDEIDTTLRLDFSDGFFGAIRSCYNARASDSAFERLSFVLSGVATPSDLISDSQHTPFNIGQRLDLTDFTNREAIPLAAGLNLPQEEAHQVLTRILYWTGGHPYLTQRLCAAAVTTAWRNWDAAAVDLVPLDSLVNSRLRKRLRQLVVKVKAGARYRFQAARKALSRRSRVTRAVDDLVEKTLLGQQSMQDSNLQFVRKMLVEPSLETDKAAVLEAYRRIHAGQTVPDEERSPVKTHLKLSGIVKRKGDNLVVRNRIYMRVFNQEWVRQNMPLGEVPPAPVSAFRGRQERIRQNIPRVAFAAIAVAILLAVILSGYAYYQSTVSTSVEIRAQTLAESLLNTDSADVRAGGLAGLFKLGETDPKYETQAHQLFATLTPDEKGATLVSLFRLGETDPDSKGLAYQFFTTLSSDERAATLVSLFKLGETDPESERLAYQFFIPLIPGEKIVTLANFFELPGFEDQARAFFYEKLTSEEQLALFKKAEPEAISTPLIVVVKGLYTELENNDRDNQLLEAMARPLRELDDPMVIDLATEIEYWAQGRDVYAEGKYEQAVTVYSVAISLNDANPATHFDRAMAYAGLGQYDHALTDFEETLQLDEKRALIVDKEIRSNGALYKALTANRAQYSELVAVVPTPTLIFTPTPTSTLSPTPTLPPTPTPVPPTATATDTPRSPTPTTVPTAVPQPVGPIALTIYLRDTLTEMGFAVLSRDRPNGGVIYEEGKFVYGEAAVQIGETIYHFDKPEVELGEPERLPDPWRVEFEFAEELVARTGNQAGFDRQKAQFWVGTLDYDSAVEEDNPYSLTMKLYEGNELRQSIQVFFTVADAPRPAGPPEVTPKPPPPPP